MRVLTCGSPHSGASTLIRRLSSGPDAEKRRFAIVQAPSDDRCTADLFASALAADVAMIVLDAQEGIGSQARHRGYLMSLLGVRRVVVAINKMDLVGFSRAVFEGIEREYTAFARRLAFDQVMCIPLSALHGQNVARSSEAMSWYQGPTLLEYLADLPGDRAADAGAPTAVADQFEATLFWLDERPLLPGRTYVMKRGSRTATATVSPLKYRIDVHTHEHLAARTLQLNDIGVCGLQLDQPIAFATPAENRQLSAFTLVDRITDATVGAGVLHFALRRSHNVHWQTLDVDKTARAELKGQKPCVIWFTGLSGAGKSTIANLLEKRLCALGCHTYLLDGDNVRHGLNRDLGFTAADRVENIRRVAEVARLMVDAGLIVLVSFISPFRAERQMARELLEIDEFIEVFVDTPLAVAEHRDPKGLYRKARRGELKNFTGIDSPYEPPENPDVRLDTTRLTPAYAAEEVLGLLERAGILVEIARA